MEKNSLRFFIIGLGSMGKRRIRNLLANGEQNIIGFDIRADRAKEAKDQYGIEIIDKFDDINIDSIDAVIISVSPESHGDYIRFALENKKHFFVEHPISTDGYEDIFNHQDLDIVKAPSCTHLFSPGFRMVKKILDDDRIGNILAFRHHMGQYLPDWHPWEDYRDVYFSKKETSACREMLPFELIGINWCMQSKVKSVSGSIEKISDLDMEADDLLMANLEYENGIRGNVVIDVISRKPIVVLHIIGSQGTLEWNKYNYTVEIFDIKSNKTEKIDLPHGHTETDYVNPEEPYIEEIKYFIGAIKKDLVYPHTFADNYQLLNTLYALEKSNKTGQVASIEIS